MKIEINMYVRIKNNKGYAVVGKVYNINDFREPSMKYCIDIQAEDFIFVSEEMIVNASHNIIDLIEAGDVLKINESRDIYTICEVEEFKEKYTNCKYLGVHIQPNKILRLCEIPLVNMKILTKEQFEANSYKVGE